MERQHRLPICTALDPDISVSHDQAGRLCRSGEYPTCDRFRLAFPDWQPSAETPVVSSVTSVTSESTSQWPTRGSLLTSLAWVIGIPTGITVLIILAIWITENVWVPTEQMIFLLVS